jgi:hypothetical protein
MEAFLISAGVVALAEIGDKTQLLAFALAARYRRPLPIIIGIVVATLANHALAGAIGAYVLQRLGPWLLHWLLIGSFLGMAVWVLIPDKPPREDGPPIASLSLVLTTTVAFFMAEMGDKTQFATIALAARYASFYAVVAGTTTGMLLANVPAVLLSQRLAERVPTVWVHRTAALVFLGISVALLASPTPIAVSP